MPIPQQAPDPSEWLKATVRTQLEMQRDVLAVLREADARIKAQLAQILARPIQGPADLVRREQLKLVQRNLRLEMAKIWTELGDKIQARRAEAAARTIKLNADLTNYLLGRVGGLADAENIAANILSAEMEAARTGLDRMIARAQGTSYVPLSQTVYNSSVALNGTVDRLINTALVRNLSAKELAAEVRQFINPNTPGGVRYAAMRLARTEINNAAHAVAVHQVQESPWVEGMRWRLSGSHPKADVCDNLASGGPKGDGVYPKTEVPAKPHPQCFCTVIPVTPSDDEFLDALVGGKYDDYLAKYVDPEDADLVRAPSVVKTAATEAKKESTLQKAVSSGKGRSRNLSGGAIADTRLVTAKDGTKYVSKRTNRLGAPETSDAYKEAVRQQDAELLASKVGQAFGVDVPEVIRISDTEIAIEFKQGKTLDDVILDLEEKQKYDEVSQLVRDLKSSEQGRLMGIFDQLIENTDRHEANFLIFKGRVIGIDHGYAFKFKGRGGLAPVANEGGSFFSEQFTHWGPRQVDFGGALADISADTFVELRRRLVGLRQDFVEAGHLDWYDILLNRLDLMESHAKGTVKLL